ncbi:MAG: tetratricopeptide repeat protein, partial [Planctomycetota bacterium]|nr:tetratricopeptide repeat protein [Planctomycetota bacterium]
LLREIQIQCKVDGIPFLHGPCFEEGDKPLGPLGEVISDLLPIYEARERHQLEEGTQPNIRGRFRDELQRLRPELLDPEVSTPPPQAEGEDAKLTFLERLARLFLEVLKDTPAVIYLSELHWSHESALEFLEYLAGAAAEERFLLIGSYRPGEIREDASKEILTRLAGRNFAEVIRLGGIDQAEVALLARSVLGTAEMPEGLVDYLHQGTGGNPFFVEEAMKQLSESGTLFYSGGRWVLRSDAGVDSAIPSEIREMIVHRLERLSFAFREILEALAAFERPATPELLIQMTGREPQDLLENLRLLEMQEFISREGSESGPRFSITHALVREVAYESMDRARRKEFHGHISDWMMVEEGESPRGNLEALAHHLFRGPYPARSVPFLIAAGDRSRWLHGDEAAIRFYMEALTILGEDDPVTSLQLLEALGAIQQRVGRYDAAIKLQMKMIQLARKQRDPLALGRAYLRISEVLKLKGEHGGAATHAEKALGLFRDSGSSEDVSKALASLGSIHWVQGDHSRALQSFEECLEVNRGIGDSLGEAAALGHIGKIHWARGDYDRSVECYTESLRLREEQEDLLGTASSLAELGEIHWARGEYSDALESFSRSLSIRRDVGDPLGVATSLELIARVHSGRGEYGLALQACAESLKILARVGNRPGLACALASIGEIYLMLSDLPVAAHFQGQALSEAREIGNRELEATILCDAALCRLRTENLAEAKNLLKQSQGLGDVSEQTELRARIDYGLACVALVEGDTREARIRGERIIESGETIRSPRLEAMGLLLRGETSLRAGMKDPAQGDIQRALDIAGHLGDPELVWQASHAAGRAAIQRQRLEDAARHFRSGVAVIEGVAHSLNEDSRHTYLSDRRKRAFRDDALALRELLGV